MVFMILSIEYYSNSRFLVGVNAEKIPYNSPISLKSNTDGNEVVPSCGFLQIVKLWLF